MIRIKGVKVNGIGPFEKLSIDFQKTPKANLAEVHIFTGDNGCGKTTLLHILKSGRDPAAIRERLNLNLEEFSFSLFFENTEGNTVQEVTWETKRMFNGSWKGNQKYSDNFIDKRLDFISDKFDSKFNMADFGAFAYSGNRQINAKPLVTIEELVIQPFKNALDFENSIDSGLIIKWVANLKTKALLAASKNETGKAKSYAKTLEKFYEAIEEITGLRFEFDLVDNPLGISAKLNGQNFSVSVLPDGIKSIISWLSDLFMRMDRIPWKGDLGITSRNFLLFLDEIDIHLHPAWQRRILPVVQKLFPDAQIFISTHSPFVVGSVDGGWIYKFKKEGQYSVLDGEPVLSEDSNSYRQILRNVFDIQQQFGVAVEAKMTRFNDLKNSILQHELSFDDAEFQQLIDDFTNESVEVQNIIGMELKQMKHLLGMNEAAV